MGHLDWAILWQYRAALAEGLLVTLVVSALAIIGATVAGVLVGCLASTGSYLLQRLTTAYTELLRNLPLIVKLFFLYFVVGLSALPAALAALIFLPAILQAQTLTLNDADTVEAAFRVGGAGKIAVTLKFADGKAQTLLGTVKADTRTRTVDKDAKKTPEMVPMADGSIEFTGAGLRF